MASDRLNILVTGAAGFIGSHLTDALLQAHNVKGLDNLRNGKKENLEAAFRNNNFKFIEGDILDLNTCMEVCRKTDIVYHLACLGVRHSLHNPLENHRVNAEGTLNMLEAARINGIKKFFYISTSEVYGDVQHFPINETDTPYPKTVYGASKLAGEHYAMSYTKCYRLNTTILRIFNNYGPRAHYEGDAGEIIPRTIVRALYDQQPVIFGDGSVTRDFYYVKDTAAVLAKLPAYALNGEIINIGKGEELSLKDLTHKILSAMGKEHLEIQFEASRPADVPRLWVDTTKSRKLINYSEQFTFEEGLHETINYYQELKKQNDLLKDIKIRNWEK